MPRDVLYRDKMGFAVPLASWFRGPLRERLRNALTGAVLGDAGLFDMRYIETLMNQHESRSRDHSAPLWSLVMFESFLRQVHDGLSPRRRLHPTRSRPRSPRNERALSVSASALGDELSISNGCDDAGEHAQDGGSAA